MSEHQKGCLCHLCSSHHHFPAVKKPHSSLAAMTGSDGNVIVAEGYYRMKQRVEELEAAVVNLYRWTGSKRCARECKRILPDVAQRCHQNVPDQRPRQ